MENPISPLDSTGTFSFKNWQESGEAAGKPVQDPEVFIRQGFSQDPIMGCELLYHRYYQNLCSYATRFVLSKEVGEDIVSDVFLSFWKNSTYQQITLSYGAYLYRAVRNRAYNHIHKEFSKTQSLDPSVDQDSIDHDTPETIMHFHDLAQRLDSEIQALPAQCRRAFILNRYEGKRYSDIAEELHISQKAVEHLISRALRRLRLNLEGEWLILLCIVPFL